jgi:hypothetical protein
MATVSYNVTLTPANMNSFGFGEVYPTLPKVFPNGNSVFSTKVDEYVDRYNALLCKSADAFIELGETLYEAKESLNSDDFKLFLEKAGLSNSKSTYSKLMKIGEEAPRLRPYVNNLPQSWTTLYALSKLEADKFEKIVPQLNAYSTAKDIAFLTEEKIESKEEFSADVTISFDELDLETKNRVFCELAQLQAEYKFKLKISSKLDDEFYAQEMNDAA